MYALITTYINMGRRNRVQKGNTPYDPNKHGVFPVGSLVRIENSGTVGKTIYRVSSHKGPWVQIEELDNDDPYHALDGYLPRRLHFVFVEQNSFEQNFVGWNSFEQNFFDDDLFIL